MALQRDPLSDADQRQFGRVDLERVPIGQFPEPGDGRGELLAELLMFLPLLGRQCFQIAGKSLRTNRDGCNGQPHYGYKIFAVIGLSYGCFRARPIRRPSLCDGGFAPSWMK